MLPFQLNLLVFLRITAISLAKPVRLEDEDASSSVGGKQARSVSSPSPSPSPSPSFLSDDSISSSPSSMVPDLIFSSNDDLSSYQNDVTPGFLTTAAAGDGPSWVDGTLLPQLPKQQQQQHPQAIIASCGGGHNRKRAEAGQQLDGVGGEGGGGGGNICHAPPDDITPVKASGERPTTAQQQQQQQQQQQIESAKQKQKEEEEGEGGGEEGEPDEFYSGGGGGGGSSPRRGPTQIFPTDEDVQLQNEIQAAKNRRLELYDPSRCGYAPFFIHICCNGELGPTIFDAFRGGYYQFVGSCIPLNPGDTCTRPRDLCCEYFRPQFSNGEGEGWSCIVKGEPRLQWPDAVYPSIWPSQF